MKSKIKYLILIILLLFISSGLITYAMFRLYKNASGNVSAARWNVSFKNGSETLTNNFNINLANATWTNPFGSVATGKIAPGSETTFNLTIDATGTETDVVYDVRIGDTSSISDFEILTSDDDGIIEYTSSGSMVKNIPITVKWLGSMSDDAAKKARDNNQSSSVLTIPLSLTASQKLPLSVGQIVYYDPVSNNLCDSTTFSLTNINNGTSTCYKWRRIDYDGNYSVIQLDHNLVDKVMWNSSDNNNNGPITALNSLVTATLSWSRVPGLNYIYDTTSTNQNYGVFTCVDGTCTISKTNVQINNVKARFITAEEITKIVKTQTNGNTTADNWDPSNLDWYWYSNINYLVGTQSSGNGNTNLSWLLENLSDNPSSGATENIYGDTNWGYWTMTPSDSDSNKGVYYLAHGGRLYYGQNAGSNSAGIRPVIKVLTSDLK